MARRRRHRTRLRRAVAVCRHHRAVLHRFDGDDVVVLERLRGGGPDAAVDDGAWSNGPTSFSYQWDRCTTTSAQPPTTGSCSAISGATGSAYTVQSADSGHSLVPVVTASNGAGASAPTNLAGTCDTGEMLGQTAAASGNGTAVPSAAPAGCSPISAVVASAQTGERFCTNAVTTCGYADPMNQTAGVPAGTNLSTTGACASYASGGTISSGTVVINGCRITGHINVMGGTVTVENSDITASDTAQSIGGVMVSCSTCSVTVKYDTIHGTAGGGSGGGPAGELEFGVYD